MLCYPICFLEAFKFCQTSSKPQKCANDCIYYKMYFYSLRFLISNLKKTQKHKIHMNFYYY